MSNPYYYYRSSLELALMQKIESEIRSILQKPSDEFLIQGPYCYEMNILFFDYATMLMELIDQDPYLNDGFARFYHEVMEDVRESEEECIPIYTFSLGLLADGIQKYGEEPFKDLIIEVDKLMRSISSADVMDLHDRISCIDYYSTLRDEYSVELKKFAPEIQCTYLFYWDLHYRPEDEMDFIRDMPRFTKEYVTLYKKIIKKIQSLGGANAYDYNGNSEKRAV